MKKEITYSFIIPHHNTPCLLQRLIDSIPERDDIEIVVVDDNSDFDKKAYINRSGVKTIFVDKEHTKGAGKARNVGMDAAEGKWLLFADSDDLYKQGFMDILDEYKDDDIDILFFNVESVDSETLLPGIDRTKVEQDIIYSYDGTDSSKFDILYSRWGPWRKMLKRQYVRKYGFFFEEVPNGNDVLFSFETSYFANNWKVDKRIVYVLTYRKDSITYGKMTKKKYATALNNIARRNCFFKFLGHPEFSNPKRNKVYLQSEVVYILRNIIIKPIVGFEILFYYIRNYFTIKNNSSYYVDVIIDLENKLKKENE